MLIAVTAQEPRIEAEVDTRFGRSRFFAFYDTEKKTYEFAPNEQNLAAAQGAGIQSGQAMLDKGVDVVLTGNLGPKAFHVLAANEIEAYRVSSGSVAEAVRAYLAGELEPMSGANVEGHWE